jgi:hypothetical protein
LNWCVMCSSGFTVHSGGYGDGEDEYGEQLHC